MDLTGVAQAKPETNALTSSTPLREKEMEIDIRKVSNARCILFILISLFHPPPPIQR